MTDAGFAFIGAVHGLLQSSRSSQKADLLLAAVLQALYRADSSGVEILARVQEIWPGALTSVVELDTTLALGTELSLIGRTGALDGTELWTLTKNGAMDVAQHADWVSAMRTRATAEVRERATAGLQVTPSVDQAELWLDRLVGALATVIRSSQEAYQGNVEALLGGGRIAPRSLDLKQVEVAFGSETDSVTQFLKALTLAGLDPLDPFGNELVSHITTGCILHAFVVGIDRTRFLKRIGSPTNQRVVLDTPVIIDLLGPRRLAAGVEDSIRTAIKGGWGVVVLEHSVEEAQQVLHRDVPTIQDEFRSAHEQGTREEWYASLTQDQLPSLCVEVLQEGTYRNLGQLLAAADSLPDRLADLGVVVRPHGNGDDPRVARLREALEAQLEGSKLRSSVVVERDANTMAMVWRARRRATGRWPGAWIVTKDRAMAPTFAQVDARDRVALTLTPIQWATLLSISADAPDVEDLARAAAGQYVDEAMWTLPVRYPPQTALELARQLAPEHGGSDTDFRVAQMTLDEALDDSSGNSTAVASRVLSARTQRVNSISKIEADRLGRGLDEQRDLTALATQQALRAENERLQSERTVTALETERDDLTTELAWAKDRGRRLLWSALIIGVPLVVFIASWFVASGITWALLGAGLGVATFSCWRWTNDASSTLKLLLAGAILDLIGLVSGILEISGTL